MVEIFIVTLLVAFIGYYFYKTIFSKGGCGCGCKRK